MPFRIRGQDIQTVEFLAREGQRILLQPGAFLCAAGGVRGLGVSWGRRLRDPFVRRWSGEAAVLQEVICEEDSAWVVVGAPQVGKIVRVPVREGRSIICQRGAYLASTGDVDISIAFTRRIRAGLFGGQGVVFQRVSGRGDVFLHALGDSLEKRLAPGCLLRVSTNNILAFEDTVGYDVQFTGGLLTLMFSGQGLFLSQLEGPGHVIVQSIDHAGFSKTFAKGGFLSPDRKARANAQGSQGGGVQ